MRAIIERASTAYLMSVKSNPEIREINTLEDLRKIQEEEGHKLIVSFGDPYDEGDKDLHVMIYDDYIE